MSGKLYFTIEDPEPLYDILLEGRKKGLFKNVRIDLIRKLLEQKDFPVQIPVEISDLFELAGNPIVKKILEPRLDKAVGVCLQKILEAG